MNRPKKPAYLSRKFWIAVITAIVMLVSHFTGIELDVEALLAIVLPVVAYILGESWIDSKR